MAHEQGTGKIFAQKKPENITGNGSPDCVHLRRKLNRLSIRFNFEGGLMHIGIFNRRYLHVLLKNRYFLFG